MPVVTRVPLQCWALSIHVHRVLPTTPSHALPGTLLTQPAVPPSILFLPNLVSCSAHTGEPCQALTPSQLAYPPSPWEVFLCSIQDELVMPDRLPVTPTFTALFTVGGVYSLVGTMSHSGFLCPEWSYIYKEQVHSLCVPECLEAL